MLEIITYTKTIFLTFATLFLTTDCKYKIVFVNYFFTKRLSLFIYITSSRILDFRNSVQFEKYFGYMWPMVVSGDFPPLVFIKTERARTHLTRCINPNVSSESLT